MSFAAVRKDAYRDVGRWLQEPQPEDFTGTGNQGKVCCVGIPSLDSFWLNGKVGILVFSRMLGICGVGVWFRCSRARQIGNGRDRTAQRGQSLVIPRALVRMHTGEAPLSGHRLESSAGHCLPVCGGLSHS